MKTDDETLMAYVDGELAEAEAAQITQALRADTQLQDRVRVFRQSKEWLREAYEPVVTSAVPEPLLASILGGGGAVPSTELRQDDGSNVQPMPNVVALPNRRAQPAFRVGMALAATVLLAFGAVLGSFFATPGDTARQTEDRLPALIALDTKHDWQAGMTASNGGAVFSVTANNLSTTFVVSPTRTFKDSLNRYCRVYRQFPKVAHAGGESAQGIACRSGNAWQTIALAPEPTSTAAAGTSEGANANHYRPASAISMIHSMVSEVAAGPFLEGAAEARIIASGWVVE